MFNSNFISLENSLLKTGVRKIITACPNCYKVFSTYSQKLETESVYEVLAKQGLTANHKLSGNVTIHDPCVTRFEAGMHNSVRKLLKDNGLDIVEMKHSREKTICCGEGGCVFPVSPDLASTWTKARKNEAGTNQIITYCAGCCASLGKSVKTDHILDILFEPEKAMKGAVKVSSPPYSLIWHGLILNIN